MIPKKTLVAIDSLLKIRTDILKKKHTVDIQGFDKALDKFRTDFRKLSDALLNAAKKTGAYQIDIFPRFVPSFHKMIGVCIDVLNGYADDRRRFLSQTEPLEQLTDSSGVTDSEHSVRFGVVYEPRVKTKGGRYRTRESVFSNTDVINLHSAVGIDCAADLLQFDENLVGAEKDRIRKIVKRTPGNFLILATPSKSSRKRTDRIHKK